MVLALKIKTTVSSTLAVMFGGRMTDCHLNLPRRPVDVDVLNTSPDIFGDDGICNVARQRQRLETGKGIIAAGRCVELSRGICAHVDEF
jgi:hypothetical protein